jgi:hypothetical protein
MYETTKGKKVDPKQERLTNRAEGSSPKAGTVDHSGQKAARSKQERLTNRAEGSSLKAGTVDQPGRRQLAQSRNG